MLLLCYLPDSLHPHAHGVCMFMIGSIAIVYHMITAILCTTLFIDVHATVWCACLWNDEVLALSLSLSIKLGAYCHVM